MRIDAYAKNAVRATELKSSGREQAPARTQAAAGSVQVRISDAGKTLQRAAVAKEDIGKIDAQLERLQKAIAKAQDPKSSAADKTAAQTDFAKARTDFASAAKTQAANLKDAPAEVRKAGDLDAARVKAPVNALKDLQDLDLSTASAEQLAQAAQVVEAARTVTAERSKAVGAVGESLTRKVTILENTVAALTGKPGSAAQARQLDALQVVQNAAKSQRSPLLNGLNVFA
jgi:hypothetical protein